jgi:hypothetical protein
MKCLKVVLSALVVLSFAVGLSFAESFSPDNKPTPIFCKSGSQGTVTAAAAAGTVGTAFAANPARLDGVLMNACTNYLRCSFTATTTTTIDAAYFYLYPSGDAYGRDRLPLKHEGNVYQGAMYFYGIQDDLTNKTVGITSFWEWK